MNMFWCVCYVQVYALKAEKWLADCGGNPIEKDAVYGKDRYPDVHVYFQWLTSVDGRMYSHYDLLLPDLKSECLSPIWLDSSTTMKVVCTMHPFFDPSTYRGRQFKFPPLTGRLPPSKDFTQENINKMFNPNSYKHPSKPNDTEKQTEQAAAKCEASTKQQATEELEHMQHAQQAEAECEASTKQHAAEELDQTTAPEPAATQGSQHPPQAEPHLEQVQHAEQAEAECEDETNQHATNKIDQPTAPEPAATQGSQHPPQAEHHLEQVQHAQQAEAKCEASTKQHAAEELDQPTAPEPAATQGSQHPPQAEPHLEQGQHAEQAEAACEASTKQHAAEELDQPTAPEPAATQGSQHPPQAEPHLEQVQHAEQAEAECEDETNQHATNKIDQPTAPEPAATQGSQHPPQAEQHLEQVQHAQQAEAEREASTKQHAAEELDQTTAPEPAATQGSQHPPQAEPHLEQGQHAEQAEATCEDEAQQQQHPLASKADNKTLAAEPMMWFQFLNARHESENTDQRLADRLKRVAEINYEKHRHQQQDAESTSGTECDSIEQQPANIEETMVPEQAPIEQPHMCDSIEQQPANKQETMVPEQAPIEQPHMCDSIEQQPANKQETIVPEQAPIEQPHMTTSKNFEKASVTVDSDKHFALRLSGEVLQNWLQSTSKTKSFLCNWRHKLSANTNICLMESCQQGKVVAIAKLAHIQVIENFADLRNCPEFRRATNAQKQAFRNRVVNKKKIFNWVLHDVCKLEKPLQTPVSRGRALWVDITKLKFHVPIPLPEPDLKDTCEYFVNRLSDRDRASLKERLQALDGRTISFGSTCSGTDICVPIMKCTFQKLNEMFDVTWILMGFELLTLEVYVFHLYDWGLNFNAVRIWSTRIPNACQPVICIL